MPTHVTARTLLLAALAAAAVVATAAPLAAAQDNCRTAATCSACLDDPNCGWCDTASVCVRGSAQGPARGNCSAWDWAKCPPPPPPPPPGPLPPQGDGAWSAYGGSDAHSGFVADTLGKKLKPTQRWNEAVVGSGAGAATPAVIAKGILYMAQNGGGAGSSGAAMLYAVNATTGKAMPHKAPLKLQNAGASGASSVGPPTVSADGKFVSVQTIGGAEGIFLYVVDIDAWIISCISQSGSQWASYMFGTASSKALGSVFYASGTYDGMMTSSTLDTACTTNFDVALYSTGAGCDSWAPTVWNDRVFYSMQMGEDTAGGMGEVDASTGKALWSVHLNTAWDGYSTFWTVPAAGGVAVANNRSGGTHWFNGVDLKEHAVTWTHTCQGPAAFKNAFRDYSAAIDGDSAFIVCTNAVVQVSAASGREIATYSCIGCGGQPIVTNDYVMVNGNAGISVFPKQSAPAGPRAVGADTPKASDAAPVPASYTVPASGTMAYWGGWLWVSSSSGTQAFQLITEPFDV